MALGCVHCNAAGSLAGGTPLNLAERNVVVEATMEHSELANDLDALVTYLHTQCPFARACTCQHANPWEQDEKDDVPVYIDALPPDDPRRVAYEAHVGRKIS